MLQYCLDRRLILPLGVLTFVAACSAAPTTPAAVSTAVTPAAEPRVVLGAPMLVAPATASFVPLRPTLVVTDVSRSGPAGTLTYQFDVATDAAFSAIVATGSSPETPGETTFAIQSDLVPATTYFWRTHASDASTQTVGATATGTFATSPVGAVTLTLHNPTSCYTFATDISFPGTASATADGLVFHSQTALPAAIVFSVLPSQNGTVQGDAFGSGAGPMSSGVFDGIEIEVKFVAGATALNASFAVPGRITGSLAGTIQTWNAFSDGGAACGISAFTWTIAQE